MKVFNRITEQSDRLTYYRGYVLNPREFKSEFLQVDLEEIPKKFLRVLYLEDREKDILDGVLYIRYNETNKEGRTVRSFGYMYEDEKIYLGTLTKKEVQDES